MSKYVIICLKVLLLALRCLDCHLSRGVLTQNWKIYSDYKAKIDFCGTNENFTWLPSIMTRDMPRFVRMDWLRFTWLINLMSARLGVLTTGRLGFTSSWSVANTDLDLSRFGCLVIMVLEIPSVARIS